MELHGIEETKLSAAHDSNKPDIVCYFVLTEPQELPHLNEVLDFGHGGVPTHLGMIAKAMYEWEGPVADSLGLTSADVAAIKTMYPGELLLQT